MRHVVSGLGLGAVVWLAGCNSWPHLRPAPQAAGGQRVPAAAPSAAELVTYLNDNARRVQALESRDVDLHVDSHARILPSQ